MIGSRRERELKLADIADLRAYSRERPQRIEEMVALKKARRVQVGDLISLVFENRQTILFQIQEMARAERMSTDKQILSELDTYNPLIPGPGELSATLFLELRSKDELMTWLPALVGLERAVELRIGSGDSRLSLPSMPEEAHAAQLTRAEVTASVHYLRWRLGPDEVRRFGSEAVAVAVNHPSYNAEAPLSAQAQASLLADLLP